MKNAGVTVWLINTGWTAGSYGVGKRMSLKHTRALISAALNGELEKVDYEIHDVFGIAIPKECPGIPSNILNPRNTWTVKEDYDQKANFLADSFNKNFKKYSASANAEILAGAPRTKVHA